MTDELTRLRQLNASLNARVAAQAAVLNDRTERRSAQLMRRLASEDEAFFSDEMADKISALVYAAVEQLPPVMRLKKHRDIVGVLAAKAAALGWDAAVMADGQPDTPGP